MNSIRVPMIAVVAIIFGLAASGGTPATAQASSGHVAAATIATAVLAPVSVSAGSKVQAEHPARAVAVQSTVYDGFVCPSTQLASIEVYSSGATTIFATGSNPGLSIPANDHTWKLAQYTNPTWWGQTREGWSTRLGTYNSWLSIRVTADQLFAAIRVRHFCNGVRQY